MAACKEWMYQWYEAEATLEFADLLASGRDFDAMPNRRVDPVRRPGNEDQFHKERAAEERRRGAPGAPHGAVNTECQLQHQKQSEEHQSYSCQRAEEIRAWEGRTPSTITYEADSPAQSMPGAPIKQKKKITWAEHKVRTSKEPPQPPPQQSEPIDWEERIRLQQAKVDFYQCEVDRLKHEQEELAREQQKLWVEQDRLEQECLHDLELKCQHDLELKCQHELGRQQRHEQWRLEKEKELRRRQLEEEERLHAEQEHQATASSSFGSHTPLQDKNGEPLDYYDDTDHVDEAWQHLIATAPINVELEKSRKKQLAQEAALLRGPTQTCTASEEDVLLSKQVPAGLDTLLRKIEHLPEGALSQLSQHINIVR